MSQGATRPGGFSARVLLDSVSPAGARVTTMEWRYPRFIHSEVLTYRMFSRNAASSRAIPLRKTIRQVLDNPAAPVSWGRNQSGMKARAELTGVRRWAARQLWYKARYLMVAVAWLMSLLPLHKQVANRLLEPWTWITVILTGAPSAFENVWRQRCHKDAQPEFQAIAYLARAAYGLSQPVERLLHTPLILADDVVMPLDVLKRVSTARCARVSYLTHDGRRDIAEDLRLYRDLHLEADDDEPPHTSPAEHVLTANEDAEARSGNAIGWDQHREDVDPYFLTYPEAA